MDKLFPNDFINDFIFKNKDIQNGEITVCLYDFLPVIQKILSPNQVAFCADSFYKFIIIDIEDLEKTFPKSSIVRAEEIDEYTHFQTNYLYDSVFVLSTPKILKYFFD